MATEFDAVVWEVARAAHMDRMLERKDPSFTRERAKAVLKDTINNKYGNPWKEVALEYRPTETLIRFSKHRLVGLRLLRGLLQTEPTKGHVAAVDTLSAAMFKQAQTDFPDEHVWRKEQPLPSFQELIDAFRQKLAALGEDMSVAPRKRTRDLDHAGSDGGEIQTGYAHASADLQHTFAMGLQQQQQLFHALDPQFHVDHADAGMVMQQFNGNIMQQQQQQLMATTEEELQTAQAAGEAHLHAAAAAAYEGPGLSQWDPPAAEDPSSPPSLPQVHEKDLADNLLNLESDAGDSPGPAAAPIEESDMAHSHIVAYYNDHYRTAAGERSMRATQMEPPPAEQEQKHDEDELGRAMRETQQELDALDEMPAAAEDEPEVAVWREERDVPVASAAAAAAELEDMRQKLEQAREEAAALQRQLAEEKRAARAQQEEMAKLAANLSQRDSVMEKSGLEIAQLQTAVQARDRRTAAMLIVTQRVGREAAVSASRLQAQAANALEQAAAARAEAEAQAEAQAAAARREAEEHAEQMRRAQDQVLVARRKANASAVHTVKYGIVTSIVNYPYIQRVPEIEFALADPDIDVKALEDIRPVIETHIRVHMQVPFLDVILLEAGHMDAGLNAAYQLAVAGGGAADLHKACRGLMRAAMAVMFTSTDAMASIDAIPGLVQADPDKPLLDPAHRLYEPVAGLFVSYCNIRRISQHGLKVQPILSDGFNERKRLLVERLSAAAAAAAAAAGAERDPKKQKVSGRARAAARACNNCGYAAAGRWGTGLVVASCGCPNLYYCGAQSLQDQSQCEQLDNSHHCI